MLLHGEDAAAWPILRLAASCGLDTRVGLEDVLRLPDGTPAPDNAALVCVARETIQHSRRARPSPASTTLRVNTPSQS
ncbi:3-keto-5-aminohexanoate cleavage protein [Streptomyces sp. NPDC006267]|uniref:3-keto-5-aminohexanoate cleavage protein n=1 Tax=Streptomyces sp. NPDC006267 TaxID=3157173 RepID=UPI0033B36D80